MADNQLVPVILAGGIGSRLWPLSRELFPKQFHRLLGEHSLLQATVLRARATSDSAPIILCNEQHRFLVAEQCRQVGVAWEHIVLEPEARSTAPAIALAAELVAQRDPTGQLLVLSSDHLIDPLEQFVAAVSVAQNAAAQGALVTFGVVPTSAETRYGYIQAGAENEALAIETAYPVRAFVEKPDEATAQQYVASGQHLWNSGMFVMGAKDYLRELKEYAPDIASAVTESIAQGAHDLDFYRPSVAFAKAPALSIDYAVMEPTKRAMVVPTKFSWADIGSWDALREASGQDAQGNSLHGDVIAVATENTYVNAQDRLVTTLGVSDLIVVETSDAVLVADRSQSHKVKEIVERLQKADRSEFHSHKLIYRPWGSFESVGVGERYQVKRITVDPGASLSMQKHFHRAEHWIVVNGAAEVTCDERVFLLSENESTYIPVGSRHRLVNPGKLPLELIEVQVGSYLGEDDIVRFDDVYGRAPDSPPE